MTGRLGGGAALLGGALVLLAARGGGAAVPHPQGPPLGHTGGFGEPTCQVCHEGDLNAPGGRLDISGLPLEYVPGATYDLVVSLTHPDMQRGGFQLAVRVAAGDSAGRQAGALAAPDGRVAVVVERPSSIAYAQQTWDGSAVTGHESRWRVRWTAPATGRGPVVVHLAANAANDDNSPIGDWIYAAEARSRPAP